MNLGFPPSRSSLRRAKEGRIRSCANKFGRETSPVGRPVFKTGRGRQPVSGGFDSHSLSPVFHPSQLSPGLMLRSIAQAMRLEARRRPVLRDAASPLLRIRADEELYAKPWVPDHRFALRSSSGTRETRARVYTGNILSFCSPSNCRTNISCVSTHSAKPAWRILIVLCRDSYGVCLWRNVKSAYSNDGTSCAIL